MTTTLCTGFLALGTGTTTFVEQTGTSYARLAVTLNYSGNHVTNTATLTYTAGAGDWGNVTQLAVWSLISSGVNRFWWPLNKSHAVANAGTFIVSAAYLNLFFADSIVRAGSSSTWASGNVMGQDNGGNAIKAGSALVFADQSLSAQIPATFAATGALPTSDPHVVGQLWNSTGVATISAG